MRIISGVAKGRALSSVADATRPTSDRAREALFSSLVSEFGTFEGLHVLDLYSGTGAIAFESLSRGAAIVDAVESDERAQRAIESNFDSIKSSPFAGVFHLYRMKVGKFLENSAQVKYHFIYIDPPYEVEDFEITKDLMAIREHEFIHPDAIIAIERNSRNSEITWPDGFQALRKKDYGQARIFYGIPAQNG